MRLELATALLLLTATSARAGAAPPDSTKARPPAVIITPARSFTILDSTTADTTRPAVGSPIDMAIERKRGAMSLEDILPFRRPFILNALPLSGPTQGALLLPGGGSEVRLDGWVRSEETTTDEPWIGSTELGWGAPWLAFALDDPRSAGMEALDLDSLVFAGTAGAFRVPGEALTRPIPRSPALPAGRDTIRSAVSRTTLVYRRGGGDAQFTGARFQTTVFRREVYASYVRNQSGAWSPLSKTLGWRYALRADVGKLAGHRIAVDGLLSERAIDDSSSGSSEWERREAALHLSHEGARMSDAWRVGIGTAKETWVLDQDFLQTPEAGSRERWEFPTVTGEGSISYRAGALTWIGSVQAASRKIVYRADSAAAFEPRRGEARARLGVRSALGPSAGLSLDGAYDARETQSGFLDGRASLWAERGRTRGRIDMESARQRPTWMDLLTPATQHTYISSTTFQQTDFSRSGDPGLRPSRWTGGLGFLGFTVSRGLELELSGSYRRVTDDFGWDVSAETDSLGVLNVSSAARQRGSGWVSHAGIGWKLEHGFLRSRGVGWIRGGPDSLSPQAGSPARRALDATLEARFVLFQGDLPLRIGVESHARGPREGLIREPGQVTWDGTLHADFGSAGAFLRVQDVFDRRPGSAIWDPVHPEGAPMPGRLVQAGVVWNLLD